MQPPRCKLQLYPAVSTLLAKPSQEFHAKMGFRIRNIGCRAMNEYTTLATTQPNRYRNVGQRDDRVSPKPFAIVRPWWIYL